jgi:hypothetical protein
MAKFRGSLILSPPEGVITLPKVLSDDKGVRYLADLYKRNFKFWDWSRNSVIGGGDGRE